MTRSARDNGQGADGNVVHDVLDGGVCWSGRGSSEADMPAFPSMMDAIEQMF
jgi:hypothetical protein